jgi:cell wall-associated NlpC family hydrolase
MPAPVAVGAAAKVAGGKSGALRAAGALGGKKKGKKKGGRGCLITAVIAAVVVIVTVAAPVWRLGVLRGGAGGGTPAPLCAGSEVPEEYLAVLMSAAGTCEDVGAPLLAAQVDVESDWNPRAESWAGAMGLAQFMPTTWAQWGSDGDGDGLADVFNGKDAITSQAAYLCDLVARAESAIAAGTITGDPVSVALAAYNAGWSAVAGAGRIPAVAQEYVTKVLAAMTGYLWLDPTAGPGGTASGSAIVDAAMVWVGYPYVWGGGTINGPSKIGVDGRGPGFDCSGLVLNAVYAATGLQLDHLADSQARDNRGITIARDFSQMQPGDVVAFSNSGGRRYQHVGIYIGDGQMVHAPTTGKNVQVVDLQNNRYYGAMVWSIRRFA